MTLLAYPTRRSRHVRDESTPGLRQTCGAVSGFTWIPGLGFWALSGLLRDVVFVCVSVFHVVVHGCACCCTRPLILLLTHAALLVTNLRLESADRFCLADAVTP